MAERRADEVSFYERVYAIVRLIPRGRVVSYGQIARMIGAPRCARQVGWAMRRCPDELPWQRVVMADGSITGGPYAQRRRALLKEEGVVFTDDGRVDMRACRWTDGAESSEESGKNPADGDLSHRQNAAGTSRALWFN